MQAPTALETADFQSLHFATSMTSITNARQEISPLGGLIFVNHTLRRSLLPSQCRIQQACRQLLTALRLTYQGSAPNLQRDDFVPDESTDRNPLANLTLPSTEWAYQNKLKAGQCCAAAI